MDMLQSFYPIYIEAIVENQVESAEVQGAKKIY